MYDLDPHQPPEAPERLGPDDAYLDVTLLPPAIADRSEALKLWLDDKRPAPPGWARVKSVNAAIEVLIDYDVRLVSLDHDLGDYFDDGGDAARLTDWMAFYNIWPAEGLRVHSSNPVGLRTMLATTDTYSPYPYGAGTQRGTWDPAEVARLLDWVHGIRKDTRP